jgi:hypothetical protein
MFIMTGYGTSADCVPVLNVPTIGSQGGGRVFLPRKGPASDASAPPRFSIYLQVITMAVRPEGANHLWRKNPPRKLSIDLEANERLGRVTGRAGAS